MLRPIVCSAALGIAASASAAIIPVGPGQSIQAAINLAAPGDTVLVAPGTYHEAINFVGKAITVRSSGGPGVTIIDASGLPTSAVSCKTNETAATLLDGFTVTGGTGTLVAGRPVGGGMYNKFAEPTVSNCIFRENAALDGGGMYNTGKDPLITDCAFIDNMTGQAGIGGAGMFNKLADPTIRNCVFAGNSALTTGGAVYNTLSDALLVNCQVVGNTAGVGAGIYSTDSGPTMLNCTVADNVADSWGGGITCVSSTSDIFNTIVWGNSPEQIYQFDSPLTTVDHCNVMGGWSGGQGSGNMNAPPGFMDPADGDYHLAPGSPCVNEGDSSVLPPEINTDLDGNPRFVGSVDMGPYEVQSAPCPWDLEGNGVVGVSDFLSLLAQWGLNPGGPPDFNGDNTVNVADMLALLAQWGPCS